MLQVRVSGCGDVAEFFLFFLMTFLHWLPISEQRPLDLEFRNHWKPFQERLGMEAPFVTVRNSDSTGS